MGLMFRFLTGNGSKKTQEADHLIDVRNLKKAYKTDAGDFLALRGIDLTIDAGEFVGVIGKSGSGKSTLINMITGIDRPTGGEIFVANTPLHKLSEAEMASWRGRNQGVVFQFFQLLPTLTVIENVILPMDFCNMYTSRGRIERAMYLLEMMDVKEQAHKLPATLSGGQQQRVAIARSLANDPPMVVADEPTGNLDSRTADQVFRLFEQLVAEGKTFVMVTHDDDLAVRMGRTVVIADGEIVNEWLARALPTLSQELLVETTRRLEVIEYAPGQPIIVQGAEPDYFHIITQGEVNVYLEGPDGGDILVETLRPGQFFGEIALLHGGLRTVTVRATRHNPVDVVALNAEVFTDLVRRSEPTEEALELVVRERRNQVELASR